MRHKILLFVCNYHLYFWLFLSILGSIAAVIHAETWHNYILVIAPITPLMGIVYKQGIRNNFTYDYLEIEMIGKIAVLSSIETREYLDVYINDQLIYYGEGDENGKSIFKYKSKSGKEYDFKIEKKSKYFYTWLRYIVYINGEKVYDN